MKPRINFNSTCLLNVLHCNPRCKGFLFATVAISLLIGSNAQYYNLSNIIPQHYDSEMRPANPYHENGTLNVSLSLFLNELLHVDDAQQSFQVDLFLVQEWYDVRLNLDEIPGQITISEPELLDKFWTPDLYLVNAQSATIVDAFQSVQKLTITDSGFMHYAIRVNAQLHCSLNLQNYPHDHQYCYIRFSSIMYNRTELVWQWKRFDVYNDEYPHFRIRLWWTNEQCVEWANPIADNQCVVATIKLVRHLSYYIIRYYLLTFLTVVISFVGFWLPINAWPARITLLVMPLLNLITQDISINNEIEVNYVTSFHWWMMWIHAFIYLEIVEYAVAIAWAHFITDKKNFEKLVEQAKTNPGVATVNPIPVPPVLYGYYFGNKNWYTKCGAFFDRFIYFFFGTVDLHRDPYTRNKIDYICRVLFVFFWLLFVLIYILACVAPWAANYN